MLFYLVAKAKPGMSHAEVKESVNLYEQWTPPEGLEIRSFHMSADGYMFILVDTQSSAALAETITPWSPTYLNFDVHSVQPISDAVASIKKGIAAREKHF